jgi:hypothetical protein
MRRRILMGILGLVALVSCSVKEDRGDCPCYLTVDAERTVNVDGWFGTRSLFNVNGGFVDRQVPRGIVDIVASHGRFSVPEGQQMDSLFARRIPVDTDGESAYARVTLCKNFATIELDFKDEDDGRTDYDLLATGTISGVDARSLNPEEGSFSFVPEPNTDGRGYAFRVPRQKDETLKVLLSKDGNTVETIDLGHLIAKTGFDWKAESLGDIAILCDLPAHTFTITVKDWEGPATFEITI